MLSYDRLNRLSLRNPPGADKDITYAYDLLGRMTSAAFPSQTLGFGYDALNRNVSATGPLGTVSYQYDPAGRRTRTTWPDGFYVTYDHDLADEMTAIRENGATSGIGVLASFTAACPRVGFWPSPGDDLGRRARLDRGNGVATTYAYDPASRLTEIFHDMVTGSNRRLEFTDYNPAGQIVSRKATGDAFAYTGHANVDRAYTVDGLNRVVTAGGVSLSYNPLGDLTSDGTRSFSYDFDDRLTGSGAVALEYDPAGRLFREQGAADTRFLYDGLDALSEYDASGARLRRYVHGPGVDEPLVWYEGPGTADRRWLLADERGSVIAWTTPAGATGVINAYDDYGIPASTNVGRFQYTGQMLLPEIGVYHYKARAYHPQLGRFLQPDPIGYGSGLNLYAYVRNDPVNLIDPSGLAWICPTPTTCHTVRDGTPGSSCYATEPGCGVGDSNVEGLTVTGSRDRSFGFNGFGGIGLGGSPNGERGDRGTGCEAPLTTYVGSARTVISTVQAGVDVATIGAAASGVGEPVAIGLTVFNDILELGLLGVNAFDAAFNANSSNLVAQASALPVRLLPAGRILQGSLKSIRGPTGLLRNSRGQFRSSYINNPGVREAGQRGAERTAESAARTVSCRGG